MQSKKGFTLLELLVVIIIIGVIALIVSPIIINTIGKGKKSTFERSIEGLVKSVEVDYSEDSFLAPREYFYEKRDLTLLTVKEEMRDEEVEIQGKIDGSGFIYVDEEGNIYIDNICDKEYCANGPEDDIVITPNPDGEIPSHSKTEPIIKLNGEATIYVGLNETYIELGAVAKTKIGEKLEYKTEIKKNEEIEESIDTSIEGTYQIIYTAENDGKTATVTRTVIVLDMLPVITMTEPNENYVKEQEVLITVSGIRPNKVTEFTYQINEESPVIVKGLSKKITLTEKGIYEIRVTVSDNNGHRREVSKTYKISNSKPVITVNPEEVTLKPSEVVGYNILTGVSVTDEIDGTIDSSKIITTSNLSTTPGIYTITYRVTNSIGNEATATRIVEVKANSLPDPGENGEIVTDPDGNDRYTGSNPNNWVCFGNSNITNSSSCDENHKWRIIGIFDEKMKIMTNYYYSTGGKAWDTSNNGDWGRPATLNTELNGSSFYSNNTYIDVTHRGYIHNATWYTGGEIQTNFTFQSFIDGEKSNSTTGYVGLMNVVDFGYAGSGCTLTTKMTDTNNACMSNNWLYNNLYYEWTITFHTGYPKSAWNVSPGGRIGSGEVANSTLAVRPTVYLNSDVKIISGEGTESNPYILGKESEEPILNLSSMSSNNKWIKATNVIATAVDVNGIKNFTYEVIKDGVSEGEKTGTVNGKLGTVTIPLNGDGEYTIKLNATNNNENSSSLTSGTYKIDTVKPTITLENVTIEDTEATSYNLMTGVTVSDNHSTPRVSTTGNLSAVPGTYTITYTATDEAGNVETKTRT
ncbi:MAG: DUF5011 domain-containing protein, partial [Bacilli bacterium]|nr:DUF5011 domain-containing protein [Bacilli bacterium]